jgi:hypothetical protein
MDLSGCTALAAHAPIPVVRAQRAWQSRDAMSRFVEHTGSAIFAVPHDARRAGFIARNCCETRGSVTGQWRLESRDAEQAVTPL